MTPIFELSCKLFASSDIRGYKNLQNRALLSGPILPFASTRTRARDKRLGPWWVTLFLPSRRKSHALMGRFTFFCRGPFDGRSTQPIARPSDLPSIHLPALSRRSFTRPKLMSSSTRHMTRSFDVAYFIIIIMSAAVVVVVFGSISVNRPSRVFPEFQGWQRLASNYRTIRPSLPLHCKSQISPPVVLQKQQ